MKTGLVMRTLVLATILIVAGPAQAAEIDALITTAMKAAIDELVPSFERGSGHTVRVSYGPSGGIARRFIGGEPADVIVIDSGALGDLIRQGKVLPGPTAIARTGIGICVRKGAPKPDISTVEKFKQALLAAKSVAYIDPASGGSSGIYIDKLLVKLGIADQIRPKAKLKKGGLVADLIVSGEAELGIHQISEIVPVKGAALVGPLPEEIQNSTIYAAALSASVKDKDAAIELIEYLSGPDAAAVLKSKGMEPAK